MRILKFGGKSLSSVEKVQNICKFIKKIYKNDKKIIIIVSAIGKTTDNLISLANEYSSENIPPRELACLLATGETQSASLLAIALSKHGILAKSFGAHSLELTTFGDPLNSKIAYINKKPILDCFEENHVAIVCGYQGINKNNEITLLGRGGSDTTAAAIGAIFEHYVEIYSDFNGIFSGDPRLFSYKKIKAINYDAMKQLADAGAKVLESRATAIAKEFKFDIISKSSTEPNAKGTIISSIETDVVSIATRDSLCEISIIFTNRARFKFIIKNVISCLNNIDFYNFSYQNDKISFLVKTEDKPIVVKNLSSKLNLLKNS